MINYADPNMLRNNITQALMSQQGGPANLARTPTPMASGYQPMPPPAVGPGGGVVPSTLGSGMPPPPTTLGQPAPPVTAPAPALGGGAPAPGPTPGVSSPMSPMPTTPPQTTMGGMARPSNIDPTILAQLTGVRT